MWVMGDNRSNSADSRYHVDDEFQGGSTVTLGLDAEGVAAVYGSELGSELPQEVTDAVTASRESIIAGDVSVPTSPQ